MTKVQAHQAARNLCLETLFRIKNVMHELHGNIIRSTNLIRNSSVYTEEEIADAEIGIAYGKQRLQDALKIHFSSNKSKMQQDDTSVSFKSICNYL